MRTSPCTKRLELMFRLRHVCVPLRRTAGRLFAQVTHTRTHARTRELAVHVAEPAHLADAVPRVHVNRVEPLVHLTGRLRSA